MQSRGEELPQRAAEPQQLPGPVPDQTLVGAGDQLHRFGLGAVAGDRAVMVAVEPDDLGQHMRVAGVAFRPEVECRWR